MANIQERDKSQPPQKSSAAPKSSGIGLLKCQRVKNDTTFMSIYSKSEATASGLLLQSRLKLTNYTLYFV